MYKLLTMNPGASTDEVFRLVDEARQQVLRPLVVPTFSRWGEPLFVEPREVSPARTVIRSGTGTLKFADAQLE